MTTGKIANGAVTNAKLDTTTGEIGAAWQSWTPTWTNVSGGTLNYAKYIQIGKTVHFRLKYTLAGAGVSGAGIFSLPTTLHADYTTISGSFNAGVFIYDTSPGNVYYGYLSIESSTTVRIFIINTATTNAAAANISATGPMTWASGDIIQVAGTYEAA